MPLPEEPREGIFSEDLRRPPNPTYFLLASPNLEDEIHFKGGRFVTSQNSKFWNVIINR